MVDSIRSIVRRAEGPGKISAVHASGIFQHDFRDVLGIIDCILAYGQIPVPVEIIVNVVALKCFVSCWHCFVSCRSEISVEMYGVSRQGSIVGIGIDEPGGSLNVIIICFNDSPVFPGKSPVSLSVSSLSGRKHRVFCIPEIIALHKRARARGHADPVLGNPVKIIVIDVDRTTPDARMPGIGVIEPIVMVGHEEICGLSQTAQ